MFLPCVRSSSLSQWVHACDALELPGQQREHLDAFIDQLYKDVDKGQRFISSAQRRRKLIIPVTAALCEPTSLVVTVCRGKTRRTQL